MATTLMPVDPAAPPQRMTGLLTISARLLPQEVSDARRARRTRGWVLVVVALVACLCAAWVVKAQREKQDAERDLTTATAAVTELQQGQQQFGPVVKVISETTLLEKQLKTVMANDLDWAALLDTLRSLGISSGVRVLSVSGKLAAADGATTVTNTLPSTAKTSSIGSFVVTGTGPDKEAVATYVDKLAKQTRIANPYLTSVTTEDKLVTFSLTADITQASLCGRFSATVCTSAGGN
jgi:hypothetical protein